VFGWNVSSRLAANREGVLCHGEKKNEGVLKGE